MPTTSPRIRPAAVKRHDAGRVAALAALSITAATAAGVPETVTMQWYAAGDPSGPINVDLADVGDWAEMEDGSVVYTGALFSDSWQVSWTTTVHDGPDPMMESLLTVTNTTIGDRFFTADTSWVTPEGSGERFLDLASSVTLMNLDFAGQATLQSAPDASLIGGYLDDQQIASLFAPVYTLQATGPFAVALDTASASEAASLDAGASMGLWAGFLLSGGDTVTFSTTMSTTTIPAPGALGLMSLAAMWARPSRRRDTRSCDR